jgi:signal transduction histidine kinase
VAGGVAEAALIVVRDEGALTYSNVDLVAAESLAAQAALALELQRAHVDREQIMLVSDRERIARDLHDHVIQQLFATGMWLQGALPFIEREPAPQRVTEAIEALDETIREIRNTIYGLLWPAGARQPLKALVIQVAKTAEEALGMRPRLVFEGPVDTAVPDEIVPHVLAVVREGLSNTARHAMASSVSVTLTVAARVSRVTVADNGVGMASPTRSSGLSNLEERARQVGGTFSITGNSGDGTRLEWTAPLPVE